METAFIIYEKNPTIKRGVLFNLLYVVVNMTSEFAFYAVSACTDFPMKPLDFYNLTSFSLQLYSYSWNLAVSLCLDKCSQYENRRTSFSLGLVSDS